VSAAGATLVPNLGADEELPVEDALRRTPVASAARAWAALFAAPACSEGPRPLRASAAEPAFTWLPQRGRVAWYAGDPAARADDAPPPERVRAVHDKAFALEAGPQPPGLSAYVRVYSPAELATADAALDDIAATLAGWQRGGAGPATFVCKPRQGGSGRGQVRGAAQPPDLAALRKALPRLAARGGAVLEPWLARSEDLSVALHVARDGAIALLGSLRSLVSAAGRPLGHCGEVDSKGRVFSGSRDDDAMREAAAGLAGEAAQRGYWGPCGVDGFRFRPDPRDAGPPAGLRAAGEFNARFTMGIVALGALRRAREAVRRDFSLEPGTRLHFAFYVAHAAPAEADDSAVAPRGSGGDVRCYDAAAPGLLFVGRDAESLAAAVARAGGPQIR